MTIASRKSLPIGLLTAVMAFAPAAHSASGNAAGGDTNFDKEQIESFAAAQGDLRQIQQEYASQIQQAEGEKSAQLQKEAQQEMVAAVEDAGLSVKEFNRISQAARNDQQLKERIQSASE
jgi:predicted ATPase with chaperone activity